MWNVDRFIIYNLFIIYKEFGKLNGKLNKEDNTKEKK